MRGHGFCWLFLSYLEWNLNWMAWYNLHLNLHTFTEEVEETEEDNTADHLWWVGTATWLESGERLRPHSRHPCDAPGRHLPPLHHPGPLPLHGVAAPGLQVYVHHWDLLPTLPHNQKDCGWWVNHILIYLYIDYLTWFLKEGYSLREKEKEKSEVQKS